MSNEKSDRDAVSKLLFNAGHRLAVAEVFLEADPVSLRCDEVATAANVSLSVAHKELQVLTAIGAIQRVQIDRAVYFQRLESAFWNFCAELLGRTSAKRQVAPDGPQL